MKILWHSNSPSSASGYGNQTKVFTPRFSRAGHQVMISSFYGREGSVLRNEDGLVELPRATDPFGNDIIQSHAKHANADVVFSLVDPFALNPAIWGSFPWATWTPIDTAPIHQPNITSLKAARWVIAMSHFGEQQLRAAGFDPLYVPHGIETSVYKPVDRQEAREEFMRFTERDIREKFVVISVAANKDAPSRKNFGGMMESFALFAADHPDALFYLHTEPNGIWRGEPILTIAQAYGIADKIILPSQYAIVCGLVSPMLMNHLYNAADVFMLLSRGEGFGIPIVEAQSAGCPVIVTDFSASAELGEMGWKIPAIPYMFVPGVFQGIAAPAQAQNALREAYQMKEDGRDWSQRRLAREWALGYDADRVMDMYWLPVLARIASDLGLAPAPINELTLPIQPLPLSTENNEVALNHA